MNYQTRQIHNDDGLHALDGYFEKIISVDEPYNLDSVIEEDPELKEWDLLEISEL